MIPNNLARGIDISVHNGVFNPAAATERRGNFVSELGAHHGRLLVVQRVKNSKQGNAMWLCQCNCGKTTVVQGGHLRSGAVASCGCSKRESQEQLRLGKGVANFNAVMSGYARNAANRSLEFSLSKEDFYRLTQLRCVYCGREPSQVSRITGTHGEFVYNGIDRADNSIGYTTGNAITCCGVCNSAKGARSRTEFLRWIEEVAKWQSTQFGRAE